MNVLEHQVLVLNRLWQPVNFCSVRRAICLLCIDQAQVVKCDEPNQFETHDLASWIQESSFREENEAISTVSIRLSVPETIVLTGYDGLPKRNVKFTRENVFKRDRFTCQYCDQKLEPLKLNIDHVIPRDKGGKNIWENVVCSCIPCNSRKANKLPVESGMFPKNKPKAPTWRPMGAMISDQRKQSKESWAHFLDFKNAGVDISD